MPGVSLYLPNDIYDWFKKNIKNPSNWFKGIVIREMQKNPNYIKEQIEHHQHEIERLQSSHTKIKEMEENEIKQILENPQYLKEIKYQISRAERGEVKLENFYKYGDRVIDWFADVGWTGNMFKKLVEHVTKEEE